MTDDFVSSIRRRGRPPGKARVVRPEGLGLHDVAVLRSVVQGVDPVQAADRYLPELHVDARVVHSYLARLGDDACRLAREAGDIAGAQALRAGLRAMADDKAPALPTLAEFAEEIDGGDFSEQELLELYTERYGTTTERPRANSTAALAALNRVQQRSVSRPAGDDGVGQWFSASLVNRLRHGLGVQSLRQLVEAINGRGRTWHRDVAGLGRDRARRVVQWLRDHEEEIGSTLTVRVVGPTRAAIVSIADQADGCAVVGTSLRAGGVNAIGAATDCEAVQGWLATLAFCAPQTQTAYARDVERLLWWASEQGKTLSALTVEDAAAHAHFLTDPPAHWVSALPSRRGEEGWRPMRGPLSSASATRALAAIGHLFAFLIDTRHLLANPFSQIRALGRGRATLDFDRAFSPAHVLLMHQVAEDIVDGAVRRRLQALLALVGTAGLGISELRRRWSHVELVVNDERAIPCLRVNGRGNRERLVPLMASTIDALHAHRQDRQALTAQGLLPWVPDDQQPLISSLRPMPGRSLSGDGDGALSVAGIHRVLKQFFAKVSARCGHQPGMQQTFERATAHFLRHTCAHHVLKASGQNFPVVQPLQGDAPLSATEVHVKTAIAGRAEAGALPDWPASS